MGNHLISLAWNICFMWQILCYLALFLSELSASGKQHADFTVLRVLAFLLYTPPGITQGVPLVQTCTRSLSFCKDWLCHLDTVENMTGSLSESFYRAGCSVGVSLGVCLNFVNWLVKTHLLWEHHYLDSGSWTVYEWKMVPRHQHGCWIHFSALDCCCKVNMCFKFMLSQTPRNDTLQPRSVSQRNFFSHKQLSQSNKKWNWDTSLPTRESSVLECTIFPSSNRTI